jgi:hypothetical protein
VCSGKALDSVPRLLQLGIRRDHANDMKFQGLKGARRSVELYTEVLSDLDVISNKTFRFPCVSATLGSWSY